MFCWKGSIHRLIIIISVCLFSGPAFSYQPQEPSSNQYQEVGNTKNLQIPLTKEEQAWIKGHPVIQFGTDYRWEPYAIKKADGTIEGFDVDLVQYINERTGTNIQIVTGRWAEIVEEAKDRKIDGLATSAVSKERGVFFDFSKPYISLFPIFVVAGNSNLNIESLDDLAGKSVAMLKGNQFYLNLLAKVPSINVIESSSEIEAIKLLIEGKAAAAIVATTFFNNYNQIFGKDIKIGYVATGNPLNIVYSIRKDWPELVSIINKVLSSLPPKAKNSLFSRWFGVSPAEYGLGKAAKRVPLTAREQAWVKAHPEIRLGVDPKWQPMEFIDKKGKHQGISSDYVRILNRRLGLKMEIVPNLSWTQVMDAVLKRDVDVLPGVATTPEREKHLNYSEPYIYIDWVIITRTSTPKINSLADLKGRVTAVDEGYPSQYRIEKQFPGIPLLLKPTTLDALQSVIDGKAEAAVVELSAATLIMHGYRIHSLKIDQHVFQHNDPIAFAVRNDWPELVQILNKGLASIARDERETIEQKWLAVPINIGFTKMDMLRIVLYVIAVMGILLVFFLFWNRRLKKEVRERVEAEKALEASNSSMKIGELIAQLGFFERNWKTGESYWSEGFYRLLAIEDGEGRTHDEFMKFIHEGDKQRVGAHIEETLGTQKRMDIEFRLVQTGGNILNIHGMAINSYDKENRPLLTRGVFQNITAQKRASEKTKQLQDQLQQSQKMEAVGTLAGGIAHDFNNILAVILGNAELAADDIPPGNPAGKSLKAIHQASIRAKDMVRQLLAFSRKSDEETRLLNMTPIVKESMKMLRSAVPTSIEFKQHISGDACNILGDAAQINQIVMNLVTNASHAMSQEGGLLEVTLEKIVLQEETPCFDFILSPGPHIRLKMRDTGKGIEPKILARIFDPYYTTKEVGKGTGMGLSVVHGIVKRHDGGIRVESTPGEGTVFEIYFPALEKRVAEEEKPEGEIKGGSESILFVDDEESMVDLNHQRLTRLGYQVKSTTKPLEALEWFKADPDQFDVIITDMTMPHMTGDRLITEILAIRPHMPTIICTGYSERISEKQAVALGARKYLTKPMGARDLAAVIREVFEEN